ncbi:competence protein ComGF [Bacillus benzoevorans]|uniref:Competence protein ComGF n=1 Tax=Bacillus benzoevorans TaxID=1456 RepID=A0A7X0HQA0_9BACI|nr:competence protein ComGF [Bacillus benzoevorans]
MLLSQGVFAEDLQEMEWEVFVSQAKKEIRMSDELMITGDCLMIRMNTHLIEYKMWGSNLRRRVDGQGHELILQQVKTAAFEPVLQGVRIDVSDTFGQGYSVLIRTPVEGNSDGT